MQLTINPIGQHEFGAVVEGVRLNQLSEAQFAEIKSAFLKFGFLVFRGQFLTDEENIRFGERFGKLEFGALPIANQTKHEDGSYGEVISVKTRRMRTNIGN